MASAVDEQEKTYEDSPVADAVRGTREGSEEAQHELENFAQGIASEQQSMIDYTAYARDILQKDGLSRLSPELQMRQEIFQRRMALMALSPLEHGVSGESIVESAAMFIGLYIASPQMRKGLKHLRADRAQAKVNKAIEKGKSPEKLAALRAKRDVYLKKSHNGRLPYTAQTAALFDIGLITQATNKLRDGADYDKTMEQLGDARSALQDLAAKDGVSSEEMWQAERVIVGKRMRADRSSASVFRETAFDGAHMADPKVVTYVAYADDGSPYMAKDKVWSGEFVTRDGAPMDGGFSPRKPVNREQLSELLNDAIARNADACVTESGVYGPLETCATYDSAMSALGVDGVFDVNEHLDPNSRVVAGESDYVNAVMMAQQDGMDAESIRQEVAAGQAATSVISSARLTEAKYKGSGMAISKLAMAYARQTYAADHDFDGETWHVDKDAQQRQREASEAFAKLSVTSLMEHDIGPKKVMGEDDEAFAARINERASEMTSLVEIYQGAYRQCVESGIDPAMADERLVAAERKADAQWSDGSADRQNRAQRVEKYANQATNAFLTQNVNSQFACDYQAAMNHMQGAAKYVWQRGDSAAESQTGPHEAQDVHSRTESADSDSFEVEPEIIDDDEYGA